MPEDRMDVFIEIWTALAKHPRRRTELLAYIYGDAWRRQNESARVAVVQRRLQRMHDGGLVRVSEWIQEGAWCVPVWAMQPSPFELADATPPEGARLANT